MYYVCLASLKNGVFSNKNIQIKIAQNVEKIRNRPYSGGSFIISLFTKNVLIDYLVYNKYKPLIIEK